MRTVFKYPFAPNILLPIGATIRHFDLQGDVFTLWAEIDRDEKNTENRRFIVVGTGHEIPINSKYIGTTLNNPPFVWHLYEDTETK